MKKLMLLVAEEGTGSLFKLLQHIRHGTGSAFLVRVSGTFKVVHHGADHFALCFTLSSTGPVRLENVSLETEKMRLKGFTPLIR